jgi:hypothetical protein
MPRTSSVGLNLPISSEAAASGRSAGQIAEAVKFVRDSGDDLDQSAERQHREAGSIIVEHR